MSTVQKCTDSVAHPASVLLTPSPSPLFCRKECVWVNMCTCMPACAHTHVLSGRLTLEASCVLNRQALRDAAVPLRSYHHGPVTKGATVWRLAPGISYPSIPSSSVQFPLCSTGRCCTFILFAFVCMQKEPEIVYVILE